MNVVTTTVRSVRRVFFPLDRQLRLNDAHWSEGVAAELFDQDGNVKFNLPNWEATDRLGWVTFTTQVKEPGTYTIHIAGITVISMYASYDSLKDTKPVKITIK